MSARSTRTRVVLVVVGVVLLVVINLGVAAFLRDSFHGWYIPSEAMTPTLKVGDRVASETLSYRLHDPRRGDIVVFDAPPGAATPEITALVKRIVGLPGERIEGRDGHIYIDGRLLDEAYLGSSVRSRTFGPEQIPDHRYFMLGDNRQYSKDSTFFGPIDRDAIIGRLFIRYAPAGRVGTL